MRKWSEIWKKFKEMNQTMLVCIALLTTIGAAFIYSACAVRESESVQNLHMLHIYLGFIGFALMFVVAQLNYRTILQWSWVFYVITLLLLAAVPIAGQSQLGAKRWIFGIQPSELAKLAIIMALSWLLGIRDSQRNFKEFLYAVLITVVPALLILMQPDLGTAMVLVPTVLAMFFSAKVSPRIVGISVCTALLIGGTILGTVYYAEKANIEPARKEQILHATGLRPHQIRRLQVFLFPDKDLHGSGYNRRQSEIAIGSGGMSGKGYRKGTQYSLGYLPPSVSSNDFIFSVLAEEAGFRGSIVVLLLYGGLLASTLKVAFKCQDDSGRLLCIGVATLTFSHAFINIAMTIGMMPITGLPLPFISYGRTFLLTLMLAYGLVQSVSIHGKEPADRF